MMNENLKKILGKKKKSEDWLSENSGEKTQNKSQNGEITRYTRRFESGKIS